MKIDVLTIFPDMFKPVLGESIIKRAMLKGVVKITLRNLRDYTSCKRRKIDDRPFGGGSGMVIMAQPVFSAIEDITGKKFKKREELAKNGLRTVLLTPQGKKLDQRMANRLSKSKRVILICGRYEGVDERVRKIATDEVSIGDYVLTGGELPAMIVMDAIVRLVPGALGAADSATFESFQMGLLEYPHYTRPRVFRRMAVPEVLLSGDHKLIEKWRSDQALTRTKKKRPDLLKKRRRDG